MEATISDGKQIKWAGIANWSLCLIATICLISIVVWNGINYGMIDIIGRNIRILIIKIAASKPIYLDGTHGAVSMSYLPGYLWLGVAWDRLFPIHTELSWRSFYVSTTLSSAVTYVVSASRFSQKSAWVFPLALLACPYPLLWPRGDLLALCLTTLGGILLVTTLRNKAVGLANVAIAITLIGAGLLIKQTYVPYAIFFMAYGLRTETLPTQLRWFTGISFGIAAAAGLPLLGFIWLLGEDPFVVLTVLTWGRSHAIHYSSLVRFSLAISPFVIFATLTLISHLRSGKAQLEQTKSGVVGVLCSYLLLIVSSLAFSAKVGGTWHHLLMLVIPTIALLEGVRSNKVLLPLASFFLLLVAFGFWNGFWPLRDSPAYQIIPITADSGQEKVLVYDATNRLFYVEEIPREIAVQLEWERGALEELTATGEIPTGFLDSIATAHYDRLAFPDELEPFPNLTAYGAPYSQVRELLKTQYVLSNKTNGWQIYSRKSAILQD